MGMLVKPEMKHADWQVKMEQVKMEQVAEGVHWLKAVVDLGVGGGATALSTL